MPTTIIEVPLRTGQSISQHPFYSGAQTQTARSSNVWQDDRGRIRRRPALHKFGDTNLNGALTGLFDYRFQTSNSSGATTQLMAFQDPLYQTDATARSARVMDLTEGEVGFPAITTEVGTRIHLRTASSRISGATVNFTPFEECSLFESASGDNGDSVGKVQILVDNLDYSSIGGGVIVRSAGHPDMSANSKWRLLGDTSGANILFDAITVAPGHSSVWTSNSLADWAPFSRPDFAQVGKALLVTDSSFRYPLRIWTGGSATAGSLLQAPRGSFLAMHQKRIFIGGLSGNPSDIVASGITFQSETNPYDWDVDNTRFEGAVRLRISADDQDAVTGMSNTFLGDMYVFKRKSMHRITGAIQNDSTPQPGNYSFQIQTISRTIGCGSHRSIQQVGNDLYWMSEKGVHSLQATQKFGDIEQGYLSFPIADLFEKINKENLQIAQSLFLPRLGLYIVGIPECDCPFMSKLLAFTVASQRWQVWDIGKFSAMGLGPSRGGETDSVYVSIVTNNNPLDPETSLAVLNFEDQTDWNQEFSEGNVILGSNAGIPIVLEPGDLFVDNPDIRFGTKSVERSQFYISSPGDFTSSLIYSWDSGDETTAEIDLNPNSDKCFGSRYALGKNQKGNGLGGFDDTAVTSVRGLGQGHVLRMRIEDSNVGRLPYLGCDLAIAGHGADYSPHTRNN